MSRFLKTLISHEPEIRIMAKMLLEGIREYLPDNSFGFEVNTIQGMDKMQLRCSMALLVMLGMPYVIL